MFETITSFFSFLPDEYTKYFIYAPYFILSFLATLLLTPILGYLAKKFDITDKPAKERKAKWNKFDNPDRHIHSRSTPYLGGLAVLLPVIAIAIFSLDRNSQLIALTLGMSILCLSGFIDDLFNMPAKFQLLAQTTAATITASSLINFSYISNPLGGIINLEQFVWNYGILTIPQQFVFPGDLILIILIIFSINAVKAVGGSDALLEGNMVIAFLLLYIVGIRTGSDFATILSIATVGSMVAFLFFNFPPAKIFTGSTGKSVYGYLAITIAVINDTKFATLMMLLLLPLVDYGFVLFKRLLIHRPKNPLELLKINDTNHLHHQLMKLNLSQRQLLFVELSITLLIGCIAILTTGALNFFFLILIVLLLIVVLTAIHIVTNRKEKKKKDDSEPSSPESRYSY